MKSLLGMLKESNLWILFFSCLPALIYGLIVYFNTPFKSVKLKSSLIYFSVGLLSVLFVFIIHWIFPHWSDVLHKDVLGWPSNIGMFLLCFVQIALLEELCKFGSFQLTQWARNGKTQKDHPVGTMFYCMMTSTGFAVIENFKYGLNYGDEALFIRAFTAIVLHMLVGLFAGYWFGRTKLDIHINTKSILNVLLKRYTWTKRVIYYFFGIIAAIIVHGTYNYHLIMSDKPKLTALTLVFLSANLLIAFFMTKDLIRRSKNCSVNP